MYEVCYVKIIKGGGIVYTGGSQTVADETRLPRTTRNLLQRSNVDVREFDASRPNFVPRICGIDGDRLFVLKR